MDCQRLLAGSLCAVLALSACSAAQPGNMRANFRTGNADYPYYTWGKSGITLEEYKTVAADCTGEGVRAAVGRPELDLDTDIADPAFLQFNLELAQEKQGREVYNRRQRVVDECLLEQGFVKVGLTPDQLEDLNALPRASEERREYLFSVATDPYVLENQRV